MRMSTNKILHIRYTTLMAEKELISNDGINTGILRDDHYRDNDNTNDGDLTLSFRLILTSCSTKMVTISKQLLSQARCKGVLPF